MAPENGARDKTSTKTKSDTNQFSGARIEFGSEASGNARGIGLFWEVKNVPHFSEAKPDYVPSRGTFILVQSIAVIVTYYLNNVTMEVVSQLDPDLMSSVYVPLLTRLPDLSFVEMKTRVIATLGYWTVQYANMQFFYSAAAIVAAVSNPDSIKDWRPLFGSPRHGCTLRNAWGSVQFHENHLIL